MKINTNLAEPIWRLPLLAGLFLLLVLLASSVLLILGWIEHQQYKEELALLEQRTERLREKRAKANSSEPLSPADVDALVTRVAEVNQLLSRGSGRLPALLASMENAVPDELVLQSLHYDGRRHEFALVAETSDSSNLAAFVSALQAQEHFGNVQLRRQRQAGSQGELVQLELNVMERQP
jgi:Tfp pilus assembly protein PilN